MQKPHPPLWVGAGSDRSIEQAGRRGFNILLSQHGTPEFIGRKIEVYRNAVEAAGGAYTPQSVGLTRALHVVYNDAERAAAHTVRNEFMQNVQDLANKGVAVGTGFYKGYNSTDEMRQATEEEALIGDPDEIVGRLKEYQAVGVDYVLMLDVSGSHDALRTFGAEIMPEFAEPLPTPHPGAAANERISR